MHRAVMSATEWDRKLIADLAAERTGLGKSEVGGVRGLAATHETRLLGDIAKVLPVAIPPRDSNREDALVDALRLPGSVLSVVAITSGPAAAASDEGAPIASVQMRPPRSWHRSP